MVTHQVGTLDRRSVVAQLLRDRGGMLVVTGLGSPSYDVFAAGDHEANYYLWGAMGGAALVGLGLAQTQVDRTVVVVTGDGEQLMGLGGLATIAIAVPRNLVIIVLDNGHYGETGMQRSHTGFGLDLAAIAQRGGFRGGPHRRGRRGGGSGRAVDPGACFRAAPLRDQNQGGESASIAAAPGRGVREESAAGVPWL